MYLSVSFGGPITDPGPPGIDPQDYYEAECTGCHAPIGIQHYGEFDNTRWIPFILAFMSTNEAAGAVALAICEDCATTLEELSAKAAEVASQQDQEAPQEGAQEPPVDDSGYWDAPGYEYGHPNASDFEPDYESIIEGRQEEPDGHAIEAAYEAQVYGE